MTVDIWEISPALPYGLFFGGDTMARTSNGNGTIYGVPLCSIELDRVHRYSNELVDWNTDLNHVQSLG